MGELPASARELRVRAGQDESDMQPVGSLDLPEGAWSEERVAAVVAQVVGLTEDVVLEPRCIRVDAYAGADQRGKHLRSWQHTESATAAKRATGEPPKRTGPMGPEERDWAIIDRLCASNERLISSLAAPVEALSGLFGHEVDRRLAVEDEANELRDLNARLTALVPDGSDNPNDPLKLEAVSLLRRLGERWGGPVPMDKGEKTE